MSKEHQHEYIGMLRKYQTLHRKAWDGSRYHNIVLDHETLVIFCELCGDSKEVGGIEVDREVKG